MSNDDLSLYEISTGLVEVLAAREDAQTPEEQAAADQAVAAYVEAEIAKVDGIAAFLRHCEHMRDEARRLADRARVFESRRKRLLNFVAGCMNAIGTRRLEGKGNSLLLRGNGGPQPMHIDNWDAERGCWTAGDPVLGPGVVPDEFCIATIRMPYHWWMAIADQYKADLAGCSVAVSCTPNNAAIREALAQGIVPGCQLLPRGESVVVK